MASEREPSFRDWVAVFGTILGASMAVLDVQIVNRSLEYIQDGLPLRSMKECGFRPAHLVDKIITLLLTGSLYKVFSTRRYRLPDRQLHPVSVLFSAVRLVDQSGHDDHLPRRAGLHRRRIQTDGDDDRAALPAAVETADRADDLRGICPGNRADGRRFSDRHLFLALAS